jgi:hypothetical protein
MTRRTIKILFSSSGGGGGGGLGGGISLCPVETAAAMKRLSANVNKQSTMLLFRYRLYVDGDQRKLAKSLAQKG